MLIFYSVFVKEPYLKLNLEIHGARNLIGKDISGNSDPFCTFYLTTNPLARYVYDSSTYYYFSETP